MKIPPKIQKIAKYLQPRFLPENYGLASAITSGSIRLTGSKLSIISPPYYHDSQEPLPTYLCATSSRLAHLGGLKQRIDSAMVTLAFPVIVSPGIEKFTHGVGMVKYKGKEYLIGLTPFDTAIGIHGVIRFDGFWDQFKAEEHQEIYLLSSDRILESSGWDLLGKRESFYPLIGHIFKGNRLGLLSLRFRISNGKCRINTTSRIVYFNTSSSAFIAEWASDMDVSLPIDELGRSVRDIRRLGRERDIYKAFLGYNFSDYFEPDFDLKINEHKTNIATLYKRALPAVVSMIERLPLEEIAALAA